jgi:hypothetical protein
MFRAKQVASTAIAVREKGVRANFPKRYGNAEDFP